MRVRQRARRLRPGDRVAVVAPAGPVPANVLDDGVRLLKSWGLEVQVGEHVLDRHPDFGYLAGTDADRAADFQKAWCDPEIAAVLCARGGYGCLRMLDLVDWPAIAAVAPKVFAGSSDVTALHDAFATYVGQSTLFTPMTASVALTEDPRAAELLRAMLFEPEKAVVIGAGTGDPIVGGKARGVLTGGNLSLIVSALGAPEAPPRASGAIAVLEDVTEEIYRLDRLVTQLLRSGWFEGVAGIALGSWTDCGQLPEVRALMEDRLSGLGVPVAWEVDFGHCAGQFSLPLGVEAELDADAGLLRLTEPALS
ncbi:LD-carboxypeptidase [Allokutzneria multivorans]|uniref:LD-carboxypeptidase n=1 Tax=Allokutzneria multivorans TaxID=1142134 RepID=A0ABP7T3K9_9PSEU